jgi:exopolysaccharide production protein ExoQ
MPPAIALVVYLIIPFFLILHDSKTDPKPSAALWVPVCWMFILASRLPSQWIGRNDASMASAVMDGSPVDRVVFLVLMALAVGALAHVRLNWLGVIAQNSVLALFLIFALLSVLWSDYPFVTFRRWFRDVGMYLMVLVILARPRPLDHVSTLIRRLSYFLVFLSIVLIKYYPAIGISYDAFSGAPEYAGATTSKNMLGAVCLLSGIFFFWDTLRRWPERRLPRIKITLLVNVAMSAMTLWLLRMSNSATSTGCLVIGCVVVLLLNGRWTQAYPRAVRAMIPLTLVVYAVLELGFDLSSSVAEFLGRDATLHGRTGIWEVLLAIENNPLVGVGYQSFWLGERLATVWGNHSMVNEAHNGYLEIYLSLGAIGLTLLGVFLVSSYRRLSRQFALSPALASLGLSMWSVTVVYNLTESAFPASYLWSVFLICSSLAAPFTANEMPSRGVFAATASKNSQIPPNGNLRRRPLVGKAARSLRTTLSPSQPIRRRFIKTSTTSSK